MSDAQKAMRLSLDYLQARVEFEAKVKSLHLKEYLGGNDNFVGRIGEFLAMRYLEKFHGLEVEYARAKEYNESRPATDLLADNIWWSVKCLTLENNKMKTSKYHPSSEGDVCPPLVVVWFGLIGSSLDAKLLAYPEGLPAQFKGKPLSMCNRFCGTTVDDVPTEKAELRLNGGTPDWVHVDQFSQGLCEQRKVGTLAS